MSTHIDKVYRGINTKDIGSFLNVILTYLSSGYVQLFIINPVTLTWQP